MSDEMCEVDQARREASVDSDKDLGRLIATEAQIVLGVTPAAPSLFLYKTAHYAPRLAKAGVDVTKAEAAARNAIRNSGKLRGSIFVDEQTLFYRSFALPGGRINIGTIHVAW